MEPSELSFERDGAELIAGAFSHEVLADILPAFDGGAKHRPGARSLNLPACIERVVSREGELGRLAQRFRPGAAPMKPVRVLLFDKTETTNWAVPWHQDRTIPVREQHDLAGFRNWNVKDGIVHVEPPVDLLARMATLRLHLDDTGDDNGPLDILPGSHRLGRLQAADVVRLGREQPSVRCVATRGDVLAMRLLTLHKSERSVRLTRRRVLHVDYSADDLPPPLLWHGQRH